MGAERVVCGRHRVARVHGLVHQRAIRLGVSTRRALAPGGEAAAAHREHPAHPADRELVGMVADEAIPQSDSHTQYVAAFLKCPAPPPTGVLPPQTRQLIGVGGAGRPYPYLGSEISPKVSPSYCHLYRWLRRRPTRGPLRRRTAR